MRRLSPVVMILVLASCVPPSRSPAPAPARPIPTPILPPASVPLAADWRDWPLTPGDWRYAAGEARFGAAGAKPALAFGCDRQGAAVTLRLAATSGGSAAVRTTAVTRTLALAPTASGDMTVALPARDPLLDAIAFSRGRFVVEQAGAPPLVLPAWPEIGRVIEDCRG